MESVSRGQTGANALARAITRLQRDTPPPFSMGTVDDTFGIVLDSGARIPTGLYMLTVAIHPGDIVLVGWLNSPSSNRGALGKISSGRPIVIRNMTSGDGNSGNPPLTGGAKAIDTASYCPPAWFPAAYNAGVRLFIAQTWTHVDGANPAAEPNLTYAREAGMAIAAYFTQSGHVQDALDCIGSANLPHLKFLAVDVEDGQTVAQSDIDDIIAAGIEPRIYTSQGEWASCMGNSTDFSSVKLWDARWNDALTPEQWPESVSPPGDEFVPYGGWTQRWGWQWRSPSLNGVEQYFLGVPVDFNTFGDPDEPDSTDTGITPSVPLPHSLEFDHSSLVSAEVDAIQLVVTSEFAETSGVPPSQAYFDGLKAMGVDGFGLPLHNLAATGANPHAGTIITRCLAAGLWCYGYARELPYLVSYYNALSTDSKNALQFIQLDVEHEGLKAAENDDVRAAAGAGTYNTGITNPPTPRNITATPVGTAGNVLAATMTITGTDPDGAAQSDTITLTAGSTATVESTNKRIFATVTEIVINNPGTGVTVKFGLGSRYALTKAMLATAKATGKIVSIYTSWGMWQDIMGDYPDQAYGTYAFEAPWADEHLHMRDLYTVPAVSLSEAPSDLYTPPLGKTFESWGSGLKPYDWTTRQAVQWGDGITLTVGAESYVVTTNSFLASAIGLAGAPSGVEPHSHSSADTGGDVLNPAAVNVSGDIHTGGNLEMDFTSGSKRILMGTMDAAHTSGVEGIDFGYDFSGTPMAYFETAKYGTGYRLFRLTALSYQFRAGAGAADALLINSDLSTSFKHHAKIDYSSGSKSFLLGTIDGAHTPGTEGLDIGFDFTAGQAFIETAKYGTAYRKLKITALEILMNAGTSGTAGQVLLDDTTDAIAKVRPRGATNYTTLKRTADTAGDLVIPVSGTLSVVGHAHADHANRTRHFDLHLIGWDITIAASPRYITFADGVTTTAIFGAWVPADYTAAACTLKFLYGSSAASNNLRVATNVYEEGDTLVEANLDTNTRTIAVSGSANVMTEFSEAIGTNPTAGRYLKVMIQRLGGDGADSNTGVMRILSPKIEYTADS